MKKTQFSTCLNNFLLIHNFLNFFGFLGKSEVFLNSFGIYLKMPIYFSYVRQWIIFGKNRAYLSTENQKFFGNTKKECVNEYLKRVKNMTDRGIWARHLCHLNRRHAHMYVLFRALAVLPYANAYVCESSELSGKRKKTSTTEFKILWSKKFFDGN